MDDSHQQHVSEPDIGTQVSNDHPVLLCFESDEEGQQHAESLAEALRQALQVSEIDVVRGYHHFNISQGSPIQFHGNVVAACAKSWQLQDKAAWVDELQKQLAQLTDFEANYKSGVEIGIAGAKGMFEAIEKQEGIHQAKKEAAFLECLGTGRLWPSALQVCVEHGIQHVQLRETNTDDAISSQIQHSNDTALQIFLVSQAEPCNTLLDFLSIIDKPEQRKLRTMLAGMEAGPEWQRATLAAFLIRDQEQLAALHSIVKSTTLELQLNLVISCESFVLAPMTKPLYTDGTEATCRISVPLFAYASSSKPGEMLPDRMAGTNQAAIIM